MQDVRRRVIEARRVASLAVDAKGERLASASLDGTVRVWDFRADRELFVLEGHVDGARAVAFTPKSGLLATADGAGTVRLWDDEGEELGEATTGVDEPPVALAFDVRGKKLAAAAGRVVVLWDASGLAKSR